MKYEITIEHRPKQSAYQYAAYYRGADGVIVCSAYGHTPEEAERDIILEIKEYLKRQPTITKTITLS